MYGCQEKEGYSAQGKDKAPEKHEEVNLFHARSKSKGERG